MNPFSPRIIFGTLLLTTARLAAAGAGNQAAAGPETPGISVTQHSETIHGIPIAYEATVGLLPVPDYDGKPIANLFFTYYRRTDDTKAAARPIVFLFNGGPGTPSSWLHLGYCGPRLANMNDAGDPQEPYGTIVNDCSILDVADLVFVDPVDTGYSR